MSTLKIPELSLVLLIGPSGSGKSTFSRRHFRPSEVVSSDDCRVLVSDDENSQEATADAFELVHSIIEKRLRRRRFTVVDATNVQPEARRSLIALAKKYHAFAVAIVFHIPVAICLERNQKRSDRSGGLGFVERQARQLEKSLNRLGKEGLRYVHVYNSPEAIDAVTIERQRLWTDRRDDHGPFDLIGDVHGCYDELIDLLSALGYESYSSSADDGRRLGYHHPEGRRALFLGDLVDRGPKITETLGLVMNMVKAGDALCVPGNHEVKLAKYLAGQKVNATHGLAQSIAAFSLGSEEFRLEAKLFIDSLVSHYVLDDGRLVAAHAGLKAELQGRASGAVRAFALYGETTGETDEFGLPVRYPWANDYRGDAAVVYGHTPVPEPEWLNNTICIDTGCVYGGKLTALRWPERTLVAVDARQSYCDSLRPKGIGVDVAAGRTGQQAADDLLDLRDFTGKRVIDTRLQGRVSIRAEEAAAALETVSRFGIDPKWLVYLPPTMSPSETSDAPDLLEHPREAFAYYQARSVKTAVCQEKHMGSRAIIVVCRDSEAARIRFDVRDGTSGVVYTRTGRRFFDDRALEAGVLERLRAAFSQLGLWETMRTDWAVLDCEILPWSFKAAQLIDRQYAAVGHAGLNMLQSATKILATAKLKHPELEALHDKLGRRLDCVTKFTQVYGRYAWPVHSVTDLKIAPFHLLATEGQVYADQTHEWHMSMLNQLAQVDSELFKETKVLHVDLTLPESLTEATSWWQRLTDAGAEGMVVKPMAFTARHQDRLIQPALKARGSEYLRLIYGPEYSLPEQLARLKTRSLAKKRSLALREFALGIEALERFVRREPLRRIHECVFGLLALESDPVDPRL